MKIILYASIALIAVSFFILVVYIARTLTVLQETIRRLTAAIDHMDKEVQSIAAETTQLLKKTNELADGVQKKSGRIEFACPCCKRCQLYRSIV